MTISGKFYTYEIVIGNADGVDLSIITCSGPSIAIRWARERRDNMKRTTGSRCDIIHIKLLGVSQSINFTFI
jgi:hypothetical protein